QGVEGEAGALRRRQDHHVPQLLAEFRQALQPRRCRQHRAEARHPADAEPHPRDHQPYYRGQDQGDPGGAVLRHEDAEVHRRQDGHRGPDLLPVGRRHRADQGLLRAVRRRHRHAGESAGGRGVMTLTELLLPAFVASLILTGIHAYLGVHVVERGVIFVDLSLAQIAALGTTVAYLAGYDLHSGAAYLFSLGFTFLGAAIFAVSRVHRKTRIPQEAIIGIVYAVSAAVAILVMSKATQETEHLKEMLVGNILSVSWKELGKTAVLYALVGLFH